jgi:hypothetical protein
MHFPRLGLALVAAVLLASAAHAQTVKAPPLPPGSNLVRVDPGVNDDERKRHVRAHHHKFHHGKDFTRDDSVHGHESEVAARGTPTGAGAAGGAAAAGRAAGTVPHGAGTGPAREKTDKGASGYFYGNDKK